MVLLLEALMGTSKEKLKCRGFRTAQNAIARYHEVGNRVHNKLNQMNAEGTDSMLTLHAMYDVPYDGWIGALVIGPENAAAG